MSQPQISDLTWTIRVTLTSETVAALARLAEYGVNIESMMKRDFPRQEVDFKRIRQFWGEVKRAADLERKFVADLKAWGRSPSPATGDADV